VDEGDQLHGKKIDTHLSLLFLFVSFSLAKIENRREEGEICHAVTKCLLIIHPESVLDHPPLACADTRITRTLCMTLHGPSAEKDCLLLFPREYADNRRGTGDMSTS
jgi:hypothetical protein